MFFFVCVLLSASHIVLFLVFIQIKEIVICWSFTTAIRSVSLPLCEDLEEHACSYNETSSNEENDAVSSCHHHHSLSLQLLCCMHSSPVLLVSAYSKKQHNVSDPRNNVHDYLDHHVRLIFIIFYLPKFLWYPVNQADWRKVVPAKEFHKYNTKFSQQTISLKQFFASLFSSVIKSQNYCVHIVYVYICLNNRKVLITVKCNKSIINHGGFKVSSDV